MPIINVPHPIGGLSVEKVHIKIDAVINDIILAATHDPDKAAKVTIEKTLDDFQFTGTLEDVNSFMLRQGWGDGLPMIPPTQDVVEWLLMGTARSREEVVGVLEPANGKATIESIAINAAMAGARPEYMPVIIAAVEAIAEDDFNLRGCCANTGGCTTLLVVNGPIAKKLNINSGSQLLGAGWRANTTIGRAIRLIIRNIGGSYPGVTDMSTIGNLGKIVSYCFAENEKDSPWEPLHVERGFKPDDNTVSVMGTNEWLSLKDRVNDTAIKIMSKLASQIVGLEGGECPDIYKWGGQQYLVIIVPEHAAILAKEGWSKDRIKQFFADKVVVNYGKMEACGTHFYGGQPPDLQSIGPDSMVPHTRPENITVVHAGGPGKYSRVHRVAQSKGLITRKIELPLNWEDLANNGIE